MNKEEQQQQQSEKHEFILRTSQQQEIASRCSQVVCSSKHTSRLSVKDLIKALESNKQVKKQVPLYSRGFSRDDSRHIGTPTATKRTTKINNKCICLDNLLQKSSETPLSKWKRQQHLNLNQNSKKNIGTKRIAKLSKNITNINIALFYMKILFKDFVQN
ncbi:hypothetical protein GQX74_003824 [Glossina fuscipes]|nr:hypothetical protein GQX74_003824 [Glossina fuscipes]